MSPTRRKSSPRSLLLGVPHEQRRSSAVEGEAEGATRRVSNISTSFKWLSLRIVILIDTPGPIDKGGRQPRISISYPPSKIPFVKLKRFIWGGTALKFKISKKNPVNNLSHCTLNKIKCTIYNAINEQVHLVFKVRNFIIMNNKNNNTQRYFNITAQCMYTRLTFFRL